MKVGCQDPLRERFRPINEDRYLVPGGDDNIMP